MPRNINFGIHVKTMYSLGFLIIELETARKRLLHVFDLPEGKPTRELRTRIIPRGCTESTFSRVISSARSGNAIGFGRIVHQERKSIDIVSCNNVKYIRSNGVMLEISYKIDNLYYR